MLTALFVAALVLGGLALLAILAIPVLLLGAAIWLVLLPFRILFHLFFGGLKLAFGLVLGLLALPLVLLILGFGLVLFTIGALVSLVAPLIPFALVGLGIWAVYHAMLRPRSA